MHSQKTPGDTSSPNGSLTMKPPMISAPVSSLFPMIYKYCTYIYIYIMYIIYIYIYHVYIIYTYINNNYNNNNI